MGRQGLRCQGRRGCQGPGCAGDGPGGAHWAGVPSLAPVVQCPWSAVHRGGRGARVWWGCWRGRGGRGFHSGRGEGGEGGREGRAWVRIMERAEEGEGQGRGRGRGKVEGAGGGGPNAHMNLHPNHPSTSTALASTPPAPGARQRRTGGGPRGSEQGAQDQSQELQQQQ